MEVIFSNNGPRRVLKRHCATLREGNVARKRRFHETLRGRSRIDFPIRIRLGEDSPWIEMFRNARRWVE